MKNLITVLFCFVSFQIWAQTTTVSTNTNSNLSISVSVDDSDYNYSASFDKENTSKVKQTLVKNLGKANDETERTAYWEGKGYSVELRQGKVKIEMDKGKTTKSFQLKIEDLGDQISETLGHNKSPKPPKPPKAPKQK